MICFTDMISSLYEFLNIIVFNPKSSSITENYINNNYLYFNNLSRGSSFNSVIIHDDIREMSLLDKMLYDQDGNT